MLTAVIVTNILIALSCFYVAWRIWQLRKTLSNVADALLTYERSTHRGLSKTPNAIMKAQSGTNQLRQRYGSLDPQLQRVQQIIVLLNLGQTLWRQRSVFKLRKIPKNYSRTQQ